MQVNSSFGKLSIFDCSLVNFTVNPNGFDDAANSSFGKLSIFDCSDKI